MAALRSGFRRLFSISSLNLPPPVNPPPKADPSTNLFVSGLSKRTTTDGLREAFAKFGEVVHARVITDRVSGFSKGFGFVRYASIEEASEGIKGMDGKFLDGWVIFAEYAKPRERPSPPLTQMPDANFSYQPTDYGNTQSGYSSAGYSSAGYESQEAGYQTQPEAQPQVSAAQSGYRSSGYPEPQSGFYSGHQGQQSGYYTRGYDGSQSSYQSSGYQAPPSGSQPAYQGHQSGYQPYAYQEHQAGSQEMQSGYQPVGYQVPQSGNQGQHSWYGNQPSQYQGQPSGNMNNTHSGSQPSGYGVVHSGYQDGRSGNQMPPQHGYQGQPSGYQVPGYPDSQSGPQSAELEAAQSASG